jgi:carboxymethylenebutenolidase
MTKRMHWSASDGNKLEAEVAEPSGDAKAPVLIVIQEWWGVNDHVRSLVDRFAKEGFIAVAPDLFHGKTTKNADEAGKLMTALDKPRAVREIGETATWAKSLPRSNGKVAVTGFCLGGALTFAAACNVPGLAAAAPFYGLPPIPVDWNKVTAPILAHFAKHDQWATVAGAEEIKRAIEKAGKTTMELEVCDAQHAFMNDTRPEVFSPDNAKRAWERTIAFLREHTR